MRSNRGGLLDQAQSVSEVFIGDGVIFSTQGRHPDSQRTYKSGSRKAAELPMVVLVNGNSASAAEIVAAALQDRGRAAVVGTTSYGKGTVQTVIRLPNEGELVLTWSRLLAPSGYTWNEQGVMPNICTAKVGDLGKLGAGARSTPTRPCCSAGMPSAIPASRKSSTCARSARRARTRRSATSISPPACCGIRHSMRTPCAPARSSRPPRAADPGRWRRLTGRRR